MSGEDKTGCWTHRICERCWFDGPGVLPEGVYRQPTQVKDDDPGACCYCGGLTITGIYTRSDPRSEPGTGSIMCRGDHRTLWWSRVAVEHRGAGGWTT